MIDLSVKHTPFYNPMSTTTPNTNIYYLSDGTHFIKDPSKESKPSAAWNAKKSIILAIGEHQLNQNKMFTAEALRYLATGMVEITVDGKRKTKSELLIGFAEIFREAREDIRLHKILAVDTLDDGGYDVHKLLLLLEKPEYMEVVDSIKMMLDNTNYAPSTITKTYLPDIYKVIDASNHPHKVDIIKLIKANYREMNRKVDDATNEDIALIKGRDTLAIKWGVVEKFLTDLDIFTADWKHLSVFLALATGRRMAEIHGISTSFEVVDQEHLIFTGQLKTKDRPSGSPAYIIRTITNSSKVVEAWKRLCILKPPLKPEEVNKKYSKAFSTELPPSLKGFYNSSGIGKYKDMRDFYARKMVSYCPDNIILNIFIAECMGHDERDMKTSTTYQKVRLV